MQCANCAVMILIPIPIESRERQIYVIKKTEMCVLRLLKMLLPDENFKSIIDCRHGQHFCRTAKRFLCRSA